MKLMKAALLVCVCLSVLPAQCVCFSRGASTAACMDMKPGHISAHPQHTHSSTAVTIHISRTVYLPQHTLMVSVRSSRAFMGLLLHARTVVEDRVVGGEFTLHPPGTHTLSCLSTADTVTHSDKLLKRNLSFTWRAPAQPSGDLRFYITVVHSYFIYWTRIHSAVVHDGTWKTRAGHDTGLQNVSASPTKSALTQTHTSAQAYREYSNTTHTLRSNFPTHTTLPQHTTHSSLHDPRNTTHTQLYTTAHKHMHTYPTKSLKNPLHTHTHTHNSPDFPTHFLRNSITDTQVQTQTHTPTPVMHTHTSPNTTPMSCSLTTHTPKTHTHSATVTRTSRGVSLVTLKTLTQFVHKSTPAPSQHARYSNILIHTPAVSVSPTTATYTSTHIPSASHTPAAPSTLHPEPSAALQRSLSDPLEPMDNPEVFVKHPNPKPNPESGIKTGGGVKPEKGTGLVSQPVLLLGLSLALLVALAFYIKRKHCVRRNGVSLSHSGQKGPGMRRVQECDELVQLRRVRENSLLLLQAQYDIITAPGN